MSSEEETLRRLIVELRILEGTAEALRTRINLVNAALTELSYADRTLEGLEKEGENAPLFVPIGGGSYIKAKLESAETVVVGVGARVAIEKTLKEARESTAKRIEDLQKNGATLRQQLSQVVEKIQEGRARLQELSAKLSGEERVQSVRETERRN